MKRSAPFFLIAALLALLIAPFAYAAGTRSSADRSPGAPIATAISTVTGIAISPLLGTAGYGAYKWIAAKDDAARAALPWYAQMKFWLPALVLVGICAAKDAFGATVPPGWKKPLDVLEAIENKFSGLVAAGAVIPFAMDAFSKLLLEGDPSAGAGLFAAGGFAAINFSWLLNLLTVPFGIAVFLVVWLASHAINVLILLSPWGAIDAMLKGARTALLGLITLSATIDPWTGALLSLVVIGIAFLVAGWAFRLAVFGGVFCWDFLTRRRRRFSLEPDGNRMFAGANFSGVPVRTHGRLLRRAEGRLEFVYRAWPWRPVRAVLLPETAGTIAVGKGLFFSDIVAEDGRTLFSLPPRYRGHEEELARTYALGGGVRVAGLRKAWSALREMLGGRALTRAPLAA